MFIDSCNIGKGVSVASSSIVKLSQHSTTQQWSYSAESLTIRWFHCNVVEMLGKFKGVSSTVNQAIVLSGTTTNAGRLVTQAFGRARKEAQGLNTAQA